MPDVEVDDARRGGRLLTFLFWTGVGLAPLAGLILLLGGGETSLKAAVVLAVVAMVLIGLSIMLRPGPGEIRGEVEDLVLDEIDMLREDVREDISSAARQTHQALAERMQRMQQTVDVLRAELEAVRAAGGAAHPAAVPVPARVPAAQPVVAAAAVPPPGPPPGAPASGVPDRQRPSAAGRAHVPTGVVRHTETVHHVTTHSTFVGHHDDDERGTPYSGGYRGPQSEPAEPRQGWAVPSPRRHSDEPQEESWTDQKLRERYGRRERAEAVDSGDGWTGSAGRRRRRSDDDSGAASGEVLDPGGERGRWVSRQVDERGEEFRLGERRAAMRASDSGTEVRIEDRWAAVRRGWDRDEPAPADRRDRERDAPERQRDWAWEASRSPSSRGWDREVPAADGLRDDRPAGGRQRRALPAASEAPSWNGGWEEPEREQRGRRHRSDEDDGHSPGPHRLDFELSDERWR